MKRRKHVLWFCHVVVIVYPLFKNVTKQEEIWSGKTRNILEDLLFCNPSLLSSSEDPNTFRLVAASLYWLDHALHAHSWTFSLVSYWTVAVLKPPAPLVFVLILILMLY